MKIQIKGRGIYGAKGEVEVGTIIDVKSIPAGWKNRVSVIENGKTAVVNPKEAEEDERDQLRADYLELTGKKADGRWSVEKLNEELEKAAE